jgi:8-oxo-dGTP diphosphatase
MKVYIVEQITEADFGCEETERKEPLALLKLKGISEGTEAERFVEYEESKLLEYGISEGKKVCETENGNIMKYIDVVAAVICKEEDSVRKIFATQRGYGEYKDGWELPGGKVEPGETPEAALAREIREELDTGIEVGEYLGTVEYDYPKFHLSMRNYLCTIRSGSLVLKEHEAAKWLTFEELDTVDWLPADIEVVKEIKAWILKQKQ